MTLTVVGIGADGWSGLGEPGRRALRAAVTLVGSQRQLDLLPAEAVGNRRAWPSPMDALVDELVDSAQDVVVLASGNPMLHGIGATLVRRAGVDRVDVIPHPSAFSLACARLGWPQADVELVSAVARPAAVVAGLLQPGRRLVVYVTGTDGAARLARVLCERGFGSSVVTVLEQLGAPGERRVDTSAAEATGLVTDPLHLVAVEVGAGPAHARTPGLADAAFASDGQLTKRHVRAVTLATLGPLPGELLLDVGAGSGSIAIEWLRAERGTRAIAVEQHEQRAARIAANADALGVPQLVIVRGHAPEALAGLPGPDAVFVGGGITAPGLLAACWTALRPGGRLVANTVTLEGERMVLAAREKHGGSLTRIDIAHAEPVGRFTGWRAQMTVIQWSAVKEPR